MKIEKLTITNYKQFNNLELDLTYPKGHLKEGKPLDKICIIGQSGTGKTNILETIRDKKNDEEVKVSLFEEENSESEKIYFAGVEKYIKYKNGNLSNTEVTLIEGLKKERKNIEIRGISSLGGIEKFEKTLQEIDTKISKIEQKYTSSLLKRQKAEKFIKIDESAWELLETKIANYENERLKFMDSLSNKLLNIEEYEKKDFKNEMQEWEANNENIAEKISDKLNTILIKFNLQLTKIDKNQKSYNDLTLKDLSNGNIIDYDKLSTGTKNLIATFIPLKIHNPKDSIILIDEPENSFYPDIQRKLTELYMEVGENNQLIFATHSPLIASSFEPWEVVELKFDENNQIYRELYFKDKNHIDNYFLNPQLLTWTSILTDIFDLREKSNFSVRGDKLIEYATLKATIKGIENKEEKMQKVQELKKLSKLLGLGNNETNR